MNPVEVQKTVSQHWMHPHKIYAVQVGPIFIIHTNVPLLQISLCLVREQEVAALRSSWLWVCVTIWFREL